MHHIAIMKKSWHLIQKILTGEKTIETRWYISKKAPWDKVKKGDTIYFKDTGDPVIGRAEVSNVVQIDNLYAEKIDKIIEEIWREDVVDAEKIQYLKEYAKGKKYCILIYLKNPKSVTPFYIDKTGYGAQAAWICIDNINKIKIDL
jgi:predicted transcriptional regulator